MTLAWARWEKVQSMDNPLGYVDGIGRNCARRLSRPRLTAFPEVVTSATPEVEPGLPAALDVLSERQRVVVGLVYGFGRSSLRHLYLPPPRTA